MESIHRLERVASGLRYDAEQTLLFGRYHVTNSQQRQMESGPVFFAQCRFAATATTAGLVESMRDKADRLSRGIVALGS